MDVSLLLMDMLSRSWKVLAKRREVFERPVAIVFGTLVAHTEANASHTCAQGDCRVD